MAVEASGALIRIPQGDTGTVKFVIDGGKIADNGKAVFTVASRSGGAILRKILTPDAGDGAFHLPFVYEDTATLKPDSYEWSLRVVSGVVFDGKGQITSARESHTPILRGKLIVMKVAGGAR